MARLYIKDKELQLVEDNPTDAEIGDKAFSNPPDDLTDAEKLAVRNALPPVLENEGTTLSGAVTLDANDGDVFYGTMNGNISSVTVSNLEPGQIIELHLTQDTTGSRTLTLGNGVSTTYFPAPTLSSTAGRTDILWLGRGPTGTTVYLLGFKAQDGQSQGVSGLTSVSTDSTLTGTQERLPIRFLSGILSPMPMKRNLTA